MMVSHVHAGQRGILLNDVYDYGEDHHLPGYVGLKGDQVIIKSIDQALSGSPRYAVHHPAVTDGSAFTVYPHEIKLIED